MERITGSSPFRLFLSVILGTVVGQLAGSGLMHVVVTIKYILNQVIVFCVFLITTGFTAPSITRLDNSASKTLGVAIIIAYASSIGAVLFSMTAGFLMILHLSIATEVEGLEDLPATMFQLDIPQITPVTNALMFSLLLGLAATRTRAAAVTQVPEKFQQAVLSIVVKVIIPVLPVFIAFTFCAPSYEETIAEQLPVLLQVVIVVMIGHYIWLALLYAIGDVYSGKNPFDVIENYGPAYITVIGTMSSTATLVVTLRCVKKSQSPLRDDMVGFSISPFTNIHLCDSALTEVFSVMTISKILCGTIPSLGTMILFCTFLGVSVIGTPGVSGGMVTAPLGLVAGVLGFDETETALIPTIFALQDSFGTACNVTGDDALAMIPTDLAEKHGIERQKIKSGL